jgi:hypothetical protein
LLSINTKSFKGDDGYFYDLAVGNLKDLKESLNLKREDENFDEVEE